MRLRRYLPIRVEAPIATCRLYVVGTKLERGDAFCVITIALGNDDRRRRHARGRGAAIHLARFAPLDWAPRNPVEPQLEAVSLPPSASTPTGGA